MSVTLLWLLGLACQKSETDSASPRPDETDITLPDPSTDSPSEDSESASPVDTDDPAQKGGSGECELSENLEPLAPGSCAAQAPCSWVGGASSYLGYSVAMGDFDGDGVQDPIWGAPYARDEVGYALGQVALRSGAEGVHLLGLIWGHDSSGAFGETLAVGDINGDGVDDLLVGAPKSDRAETYAGEAHLYYGRAGGWEEEGPPEQASWAGVSSYSYAGTGLASGDLNGDGMAEIWISGERTDEDDDGSTSGQVYGLAGGGSWSGQLSVADADWTLESSSSNDDFGRSMHAGEDLDGDGYGDLLVAAPYGQGYRGEVYAFAGGADFTPPATAAEASQSWQGASSYDAMGWELIAKDLNGDGAAEIIASAPLSDEPWEAAGSVRIFEGGSEVFSSSKDPMTTITGPWDQVEFGYGLAAGDVDGDGLGDLVVGAIYTWEGLITKGGSVWLYPGRETWTESMEASEARWSIHGEAVRDYLGFATALGDMTGDGRAELLLGTGFHDLDEGSEGKAYLFFGE